MTGAVFALVLTPFAGVMMDHGVGGVGFAVLGVNLLILALPGVIAHYVCRSWLRRTDRTRLIGGTGLRSAGDDAQVDEIDRRAVLTMAIGARMLGMERFRQRCRVWRHQRNGQFIRLSGVSQLCFGTDRHPFRIPAFGAECCTHFGLQLGKDRDDARCGCPERGDHEGARAVADEPVRHDHARAQEAEAGLRDPEQRPRSVELKPPIYAMSQRRTFVSEHRHDSCTHQHHIAQQHRDHE